MDEVTQFNIEGKVVYHNLPGIYEPLQEIDPFMHRLCVMLNPGYGTHISISHYRDPDGNKQINRLIPPRSFGYEDILRTKKSRVERDRIRDEMFYDSVVTLCRGGDYQVHIFPHGHIFLSGIENIVHQEKSMPKEKNIETPTTNNGLEID